jgi:hypothetical protein
MAMPICSRSPAPLAVITCPRNSTPSITATMPASLLLSESTSSVRNHRGTGMSLSMNRE